MTKKHFIALADAIKSHNGRYTDKRLHFSAAHLDTLADFCRSTNFNFKGERWLGYIAGTNGKNGGKVN